METDPCEARQVLLGLDFDGLKKLLDQSIGCNGTGPLHQVPVLTTLQVDVVLRYAHDHSGKQNRTYIDTLDILWGLVSEEESVASRLLKKHGLSMSGARSEPAGIITETGSGSEEPPVVSHEEAAAIWGQIASGDSFDVCKRVIEDVKKALSLHEIELSALDLPPEHRTAIVRHTQAVLNSCHQGSPSELVVGTFLQILNGNVPPARIVQRNDYCARWPKV
jgi:ATP-dependent Clp protease ATP-binding subunit ClpA